MAKARLDVLQAVVLLRRRAQRLRQQRQSSTRSESSPRRERKACRRRRSGRRGRGRRAARALPRRARRSARAAGCDRSGRRGRRGRLALSAPRGQAAGDAVARIGLGAGLELVGARTSRSARRRDRRAERLDAFAAQRSSFGGGEQPGALVVRRVAASSGAAMRPELLQPDVDLRDLQLALLAVGQQDGDDLVALVPISALPTATRSTACARQGSPRRSRRSCTSRFCRWPGP